MTSERAERLRDVVLAERASKGYKKHSTVKVPEVEGGKVLIETRSHPGTDWPVYRLEAVVKADFKKMCAFMSKSGTEKAASQVLTPDVKKVEVVEKTDDGWHVYRVDKAPWPLSSRDSYFYCGETVEPDGSFVMFAKSQGGRKPDKEDYVRLDVFVSGTIVKDEGNGMVRVFRTSGSDPGGNLPIMVVDAFASDMAVAIGRVKKAIRK